MKLLSIFLILICITFQACDSGSKKTAVVSSPTKTEKNTVGNNICPEITNIINGTENSSKLTTETEAETKTNLIEWKKELSEKLKPIPLTSPSSSHSKLSSTTKEKVSAKNSHKTKLTMAGRSERYKSANPTKELDLSEENNFGKIRKVEFEKNKTK